MMADDPIFVEPVDDGDGRKWQPAVGPETLGFLEHSVPEPARESIRVPPHRF